MIDEKDKVVGQAPFLDPGIRVKDFPQYIAISVAALYHPILGGRGAVLKRTK